MWRAGWRTEPTGYEKQGARVTARFDEEDTAQPIASNVQAIDGIALHRVFFAMNAQRKLGKGTH